MKDNLMKSGIPENCTDQSVLFIQAPCTLLHSKIVKERKLIGLEIASLFIFVALFSLPFFEYVDQVNILMCRKMNMMKLTAEEYTF